MKLTICYFASLREALGQSQEVSGLPPELSVAQLREILAATSHAHALHLGPQKAVRCAINHRMAQEGEAVPDGAEVAFFPPVTGG